LYRVEGIQVTPRCTRECRTSPNVDISSLGTGVRPMSSSEWATTSNLSHNSRSHVGGAGNRASRHPSDISCHEPVRGAGTRSHDVDDLFYVVPDAVALLGDRRLGETPSVSSKSVGGGQSSRMYVCTTGTNLFRILALSDRLSSQQIDDDSRRPNSTTDSRGVTSSADVMMLRDNEDSSRTTGSDSVGCGADDTYSASPGCMSDVDDNSDKRDCEEVLGGSMTAAAQQGPPPATWPAPVTLSLGAMNGDDNKAKRRRARSMSMSYRDYSHRVFRGAPKLLCYGVDDRTTSSCRHTSVTNLMPGAQTTPTSASRDASTLRPKADPLASRHGLVQSKDFTMAVAGNVLYDKPSQLASAKRTGTISDTDTVRGDCSVYMSRSFLGHSDNHHLRQRQSSQCSHHLQLQLPDSSSSSRGRAASLMMKWLRQTGDYQCATTNDDIISDHVTISSDGSTAAVTKRNDYEDCSFTRDNSNDAYVRETSAHDTDTISGREIASCHVMAGKVVLEKQRDDILFATDDDDVTTEDRLRTRTAGKAQMCCSVTMLHCQLAPHLFRRLILFTSISA